MKKRFLLLLVALLVALLAFSSCKETGGEGSDGANETQGDTSTDTADTGTGEGNPSDSDNQKPSDSDNQKPNDSDGSSIMEHKHAWGEFIAVKDATCAEEGVMSRLCPLCGEAEEKTVPKTAHEYQSTTVAPVGGKPGYIEYKCSGCGDTYQEEIELEYPTGFEYEVNDDGTTCTITSSGTCWDEKLAIPPQIDGYTVTSIGEGAFKFHNAREIIIPDTVTSIEYQAFYWCTGLVYLTLGKGVESIGVHAFDGCNMLVDIANYSSLTLTKGASDNGCVAKKAISIHTGEASGKYGEQGMCAFYELDGSVYMISYLGEETVVTLPNDYNAKPYEIYTGAFPSTKTLYSITLPYFVTKIHDGAFEGQSNLVEVINLSKLEINVGDTANGGVAQNAIEVHKGVSKLTEKDGYLFYELDGEQYLIAYTGWESELTLPKLDGKAYSIYDSAFYMSSVTKVTIPEGVTSIGASAFDFCFSLAEIELPTTLEVIGERAFYACPVKSISIPSSVREIGKSAFSMSAIESISIPASVEVIGEYAFQRCEMLASVELNEGLKTIGMCAFDNCTSLKEIDVPNTVTSLDIRAFALCTSLTRASVGNGVTTVAYLFEGCTLLADVTLPSGLKEISLGTFKGCSALKEITIPNEVELIGMHAFEDCITLSSVEIPDSVSTIQIGAFNGCKSLKSVKLGNGVSSISADVFRETSIEEIVLPESVNKIDDYAFYFCDSLKKVVLPTVIYDVGYNAFEGCGSIEFFYRGDKEDAFEYRISWLEDEHTLYVYSEDEPSDTEYSYWCYDSNGDIYIWQ